MKTDAKAGQRRHTLLVVDDEVEITTSLYDLFRLEYQVYTANSAAEALEILDNFPVHIILADQRMPGMTGAQLLARVRGMPGDIVRLMMTGYADIKVVVDAINRGHVFRYVEKPWDPDELRSVLAQAAHQYNLLAERRRLIQELSAANRDLRRIGSLKTAFMEMAGHELRTPITYILGMSDLLARAPDDRPMSAVKDKLSRIGANCRKLQKVVEGMLKSVASDSFHMELVLELVAVGEVVREVAAELAPFLEQRHLNLAVEVPADVPDLYADRGKLRDILYNLLTNAIRFTPDGGQIKCAAEFLPPDRVRISVTDNGVGIAAADLPHIFEPFYGTADVSHHHSSTDLGFGQRGPGLGLSIVRRFAEMHGGKAEARSVAGKGSRFDVILPLRAGPLAAPPSLAEPAAAPPEVERVLSGPGPDAGLEAIPEE